jgi:hypothetical protein
MDKIIELHDHWLVVNLETMEPATPGTNHTYIPMFTDASKAQLMRKLLLKANPDGKFAVATVRGMKLHFE